MFGLSIAGTRLKVSLSGTEVLLSMVAPNWKTMACVMIMNPEPKTLNCPTALGFGFHALKPSP